MTLNIKLPEVVSIAAMRALGMNVRIDAAIIAALEKMVEIGMARQAYFAAVTDATWEAWAYKDDDRNGDSALIIHLDGGESDD